MKDKTYFDLAREARKALKLGYPVVITTQEDWYAVCQIVISFKYKCLRFLHIYGSWLSVSFEDIQEGLVKFEIIERLK